MTLAPIILFTYNRPEHTKQVLNALAQNMEAKHSSLFIFSDAAKQNATEAATNKVKEVRKIINAERRFAKIIVREQQDNKGLAQSVIDGVSEVFRKYNRVIVLEDDLVPSIGFLDYMNSGLELYRNDQRVSAIHAWAQKFPEKFTTEETYFIRGADCWGWGTWKRNWQLFNQDAKQLHEMLSSRSLENHFNLFGAIDYMGMLKNQIEGKIDSWAIRWQASMFLENKLCLHPVQSLIRNIGMDGSGVHCDEAVLDEEMIDKIKIKKLLPEENIGFYFAMYKKNRIPISRGKTCNKIFSKLKQLLPPLYKVFGT